jgi:uncharacterized phiE125 gp8 family phage protein
MASAVFDLYGNPIHFSLTRTVDAAAEPLTGSEMKAALRVDTTTEDALIDAYIKAARQKVEADTGRALINQTWALSLDRVPVNGGDIVIPIAPLSSVTSVKSYAEDGTESTVATSVYRVDTASVPGRIVLKSDQSWPTGLRDRDALLATFVAGYGAAAANISDVSLVQAVRVLVAHWYENRGLAGHVGDEIEMGYRSLIRAFKVAWY